MNTNSNSDTDMSPHHSARYAQAWHLISLYAEQLRDGRVNGRALCDAERSAFEVRIKSLLQDAVEIREGRKEFKNAR
jgi:hypothetical protein